MGTNKTIDPLAVIDLLEDELEERQTKADRRRQDAAAAERLKIEQDRRSGADRRND